MSSNLVEEIAAKAATLPEEKQREALAFVESLRAGEHTAAQNARPFRSVKGILQRNLDNLEQEITEMRQEALKNFPREESE